MTTAVSPTQILDSQRIQWGNWVMGQHMQTWNRQAREQWVGHVRKEVVR